MAHQQTYHSQQPESSTSGNNDDDREWRACLDANGIHPIELIGDGTYSKVWTCDIRNSSFLPRSSHCGAAAGSARNPQNSHGNRSPVSIGNHTNRNNIQAIKVIDERNASEAFRTRFLPRELDLISRGLNHPNIVGDFRWFKLATFTFIVKQYITRNGAFHETGPMDLPHVIFRQLCAGVRYLHSRQIAHRDLKCENVFLDRSKNAKIGDFGFGRRMKSPVEMSRTWCGSKAYAAPEVVHQLEYNPFISDFWSLGIILYVMLEAAFPFDDRHNAKLLRAFENPRQSVRFHRINRRSPAGGSLVKDFLFMLLEPVPDRRATFVQLVSAPWLRQTAYVMYEVVTETGTVTETEEEPTTTTVEYSSNPPHSGQQSGQEQDLCVSSEMEIRLSEDDQDDITTPSQTTL